MYLQLVTGTATQRLSNHLIVDSPALPGGPAKALNLLVRLRGALATSCTFMRAATFELEVEGTSG
jgi:hypothetical protein